MIAAKTLCRRQLVGRPWKDLKALQNEKTLPRARTLGRGAWLTMRSVEDGSAPAATLGDAGNGLPQVEQGNDRPFRGEASAATASGPYPLRLRPSPMPEGAVKPPVFLTSTFVFRAPRRARVLRRRRRAQAGAGRHGGRARLSAASTTPTPRSSRTASRSTMARRACAGDRLGHGGDRRGDADLPASGRRSPALAAALRRHRDADRQGAARLRHRGRPFTDGTDEATAAPGAGGAGAARARQDRSPRDARQPHQHAGRPRARAARRRRLGAAPGSGPLIVCDNTLLGPVFQRPLAHGVDICVYSLTKYVGGHSDLIAGGGTRQRRRLMKPIARCAAPSASSSTRIPAGCSRARWRRWRCAWSARPTTPRKVAEWLATTPFFDRSFTCQFRDDRRAAIYARQCTGPGSTFSFDIEEDNRRPSPSAS